MRQQRLELAQARLDFTRFAAITVDGIQGLEAVAGDADNSGRVLRNLAGRNKLLRHAHGHAAGGLGKNAFRLGEQLDRVADFVVGHVVGRGVGFAHHLERIETVGRRADGERFRNRVGLHGFKEIQASALRGGNRRATGGLRAVNLRRRFGDEADLRKFLIAFVDLSEQRTGRHRDDGVIGRAPAELFGNFIRHALGTFGVVGAHIDVHKRPAKFAGDLGAEAVHFVVMAFDADDVGAVDERVENLALFQIGRNEHVGFKSGARSIGGNGVREVAGRGARDGLETEFLRAAQGHADDAVLERERGVIDSVVLDVKFADAEGFREAVGLDERREANERTDGRFARDGQQLAVTPHGLRARGDDVARERLLDAVVIVGNFERAEVEFADMRGFERVFATAFAALERFHVTLMLFTHNFYFCHRGTEDTESEFVFISVRSVSRWRFCFLKQKSPDSQGEGATKRLLRFSFFPKLMMLELELAPVIETKFNRLPWCQRASPSTTLYESVKSTDADRLILIPEAVKSFLQRNKGWCRWWDSNLHDHATLHYCSFYQEIPIMSDSEQYRIAYNMLTV